MPLWALFIDLVLSEEFLITDGVLGPKIVFAIWSFKLLLYLLVGKFGNNGQLISLAIKTKCIIRR